MKGGGVEIQCKNVKEIDHSLPESIFIQVRVQASTYFVVLIYKF